MRFQRCAFSGAGPGACVSQASGQKPAVTFGITMTDHGFQMTSFETVRVVELWVAERVEEAGWKWQGE